MKLNANVIMATKTNTLATTKTDIEHILIQIRLLGAGLIGPMDSSIDCQKYNCLFVFIVFMVIFVVEVLSYESLR